MEKIAMRDWVSSLEGVIDNKLKKWIKPSRIENGKVVQVVWQFEQTHVIMDVFWHDEEELVHLDYRNPYATHGFMWRRLNDETFNKAMDRIGNLAQMTMYPPDAHK